MAWSFTKKIGQESMAMVPKLALYTLFFSIHKNSIFEWERIISSELSFHLGNFHKSKRFYISYLIFILTYCHVFKGLPLSKKANCKIDPIQMWYPTLWKKKYAYNFYEVHNAFISSFKR